MRSKINIDLDKNLNDKFVEQMLNSLTEEERIAIENARKRRKERKNKTRK